MSPDPVKAAALANAVDFMASDVPVASGAAEEQASAVIDVAKMFEQYLRDESS
jgi:hypothetical protein